MHTHRNQIQYSGSIEQIQMRRALKWDAFKDYETIQHQIDHNVHTFRKGFTFTPFANPRVCNAHCCFCSEELRRVGQHIPTSKTLIGDYEHYFKALDHALQDLNPMQFGLSLSGLEATVELRWLLGLLEVLHTHRDRFDERVLYTNGSGFVNSAQIVKALVEFGFDRFEISRCHHDERVNQKIMRFDKAEPIACNASFETLFSNQALRQRSKVSCILTDKGIKTEADIVCFLKWCDALGVTQVVFRELSMLPEHSYEDNYESRWIGQNRVSIDSILQGMTAHPSFEFMHSASGYYYYNETYKWRGIEVTFETSSYGALMTQNASNVIHKLVFHSNGNLTTDWDPQCMIVKQYSHVNPLF